MTANRWWVRMTARWIARIDSVQTHLALVFQGMTGVSLASGALKYFGAAWLVPYFIGTTAVGVLAYAYLYSEGGVWNQVNRDKQDLSNNFANPNSRIVSEMNAREFVAGMQADELSDEQREAIKREGDAAFNEFSDGVDLEAYGR